MMVLREEGQKQEQIREDRWEKRVDDEWVRQQFDELVESLVAYQYPMAWYDDNHPFDRSGQVRPMVFQDLAHLYVTATKREDPMNREPAEVFLGGLYTRRTSATFESGCGLRFDTFLDLLKRAYEECCYERYPIYDGEADEYDDDLDLELMDLFYHSLTQLEVDPLYDRLEKQIREMENANNDHLIR